MAEIWITTSEAANISGYHPDYVRKLLKSDKIVGRKWGQTWMVNRESLSAYLKTVQSKGKKRGPKKDY